MRFAGTWKQYSAKAMTQLIRITLKSGAWRYFKWPYQAKVMKMLEIVRRMMVVMRPFSTNLSILHHRGHREHRGGQPLRHRVVDSAPWWPKKLMRGAVR